jgi:signal transduction histidine kinase
VIPTFLVFAGCELIAVVSKLWLLGIPAYNALGVAAVLYFATLVGQARNSAIAVRTAIDLRFENLDLIERLRLETEKAQAAHREAERANLAKSKFLAAASHDLRQPIHAQGLFLEVLGRSGLSESQEAVLASARAASEASAGMLNTLLDFSRIEAGVVEPQIRPFHLQPLLNKIENDLAPQADAKGIVYRSRETHAAVESDPALVELIVRNLVSNAIRYTGHGGVLVACRARGERVVLEVWDTGIGIEPAQQREIFREFHQLGNPERDRDKGLGLGLAIAEGLARALGHELSLASAPRRGSVFRLALPLSRAAVVDDELKYQHAPALDARVLVIDDDVAVRAGMAQLLRGWGCTCVTVESIEEALKAARATRPDIVVSDYRLREQRTGAQAIAALRAEFGANLPALLITGDTAPERLREARASDIPLLHKPVSPARLYHRLACMLADNG